MNIHIVNGPNLNLTGRREVEFYGSRTFEDFLAELRCAYPMHRIEYYQSNHEGDIIDYLHAHGFESDGIVLNAGAYTHTSIAVADAIKAIDVPVIEVHMSNIHARESYRRVSLIAPVCRGSISGLGLDSYRLALEALLRL